MFAKFVSVSGKVTEFVKLVEVASHSGGGFSVFSRHYIIKIGRFVNFLCESIVFELSLN